MDLVVGFDLDMTLVDSRPCVLAVAKVLAEEEGVVVDGELWASRLGPPIIALPIAVLLYTAYGLGSGTCTSLSASTWT